MAILGKFTKQPIEVLDYQFDFSAWLADRGDTISGVPTVVSAAYKTSVLGASPLVISGVSTNIGIVKFFASAGTDGSAYEITCTFSTVGGRTKQSEMVITVKET